MWLWNWSTKINEIPQYLPEAHSLRSKEICNLHFHCDMGEKKREGDVEIELSLELAYTPTTHDKN